MCLKFSCLNVFLYNCIHVDKTIKVYHIPSLPLEPIKVDTISKMIVVCQLYVKYT